MLLEGTAPCYLGKQHHGILEVWMELAGNLLEHINLHGVGVDAGNWEYIVWVDNSYVDDGDGN